jgi:threonine dehydrogenase-like Zn-dependent dehydrogenase
MGKQLMKALVLYPKKHLVELEDVEEPQIKTTKDLKIKVLEVGICGTDKELIRTGGDPSWASDKMIIGHEMIGKVIEVGKNVTLFKPGDIVTVTIRRGCNHCPSCLQNRPDLCYTTDYLDRGIKGLDGFNAEYVVEEEKHVIKIPNSILNCAILCEPGSSVEKGIEQMLCIQKIRLPDWEESKNFSHKKALIVGLGTLGLLACVFLKQRGFQLFGADIYPTSSKRCKILKELDGTYIDLNQTSFKELGQNMDLIIECVGIAKVNFDLLHALGPNGGCVMLGIPDRHATCSIEGGQLMLQLVVKNQVILGVLNAGKQHWEQALKDLEEAQKKWPDLLSQLITHHLEIEEFDFLSKREGEEIKSIFNWY